MSASPAPPAAIGGTLVAATTAEALARGRERGEALAGLCRLHIARVPLLVFVAGALAAGATSTTLAAGVGLILASCAIGGALNDRADVESDRANGRLDRPLAAGVLDERDVRAVVWAASLVVVVSAAALPRPGGLVVAVLAGAVSWATTCEPVALQRRGVLGLLALALGYLVLPAALAIGPAAAVHLSPLVLLGAGVLAHKDVRDEVGDRLAGKRTLLVRRGERSMTAVAALLASSGAVGLARTLGPGWWLAGAAVVVALLWAMAIRGHRPAVWAAARLALVLTAAAATVHVVITLSPG